ERTEEVFDRGADLGQTPVHHEVVNAENLVHDKKRGAGVSLAAEAEAPPPGTGDGRKRASHHVDVAVEAGPLLHAAAKAHQVGERATQLFRFGWLPILEKDTTRPYLLSPDRAQLNREPEGGVVGVTQVAGGKGLGQIHIPVRRVLGLGVLTHGADSWSGGACPAAAGVCRTDDRAGQPVMTPAVPMV